MAEDKPRGRRIEIGEGDPPDEGTEPADVELPEPEEDPLDHLEAELEAEKEAHLRTIAELRNYRQRMARDQEEQRKYAISGVIEELLPTLDHLEMALLAAQEHGEGGTALAEGVWMTYRQLLETLGRFGLQVISGEGEVFDPQKHEALEAEEVAPGDPIEGTVTGVLRKGYMLHDRVVRPAQVRVAVAR